MKQEDHCRKLFINKIKFFCSLKSLISSAEMELIIAFHNKTDPLHQTLFSYESVIIWRD